jgi:hypothetical protein
MDAQVEDAILLDFVVTRKDEPGVLYHRRVADAEPLQRARAGVVRHALLRARGAPRNTGRRLKMKRSLVSLAAMAAAGAARAQSSVALHGAPETALSLEGMRSLGYPEEAVREAGQRQIREAIDAQLADLSKTMVVPREMLLKPHQDDILRRVREHPFWSLPRSLA